MKIQDFTSTDINGRKRVSARLIWEENDHPAQTLYFETPTAYAEGLVPDPHAFLIAGALPAMHFGEKRIWVDGPVCPQLLENIDVALHWIVHWFYPGRRKPIPIATAGMRPAAAEGTSRAGFLFSGGVDSLATLRHNHLNYPSGHPARILDGLIIYGLEVQNDVSFNHVLRHLEVIAADADIRMTPLYTNIRELGPENDRTFWADFWLKQYMGATFGAAIHALSGRFSLFSINSCHDIPNLIPYSSHPLVNPYYSSADLRIRHEGINFSRYEKTRIISDWQVAIDNLRVCNDSRTYQQEILNCGVCERCVRTMLAMLCCGVLDRSGAFAENNVTTARVEASVIVRPNNLPMYRELFEPLRRIGREDLLKVVQVKIDEFEKRKKVEEWTSRTMGPLATVDRKHLHSVFGRTFRSIYGRIL